MANGIKEAYLNQYKDIASQNLNQNRQNLSYTDSPIFQKGYEAWNPTGIGSLTGQNLTLPMVNLAGLAGGFDVSGIANVFGDQTSAAFANKLINPVFSGTATYPEKLKYANVFGHEMSHLGWDYKKPSERINVPGVGIEGDEAFAKSGLSQTDYGGEEQWNYMHDLMYGPRSKYIGEDLSKMFTGLPKGSPQKEKALEEAQGILKDFGKSGMTTYSIPGKDYLTDKGLINKGDLSYTPKAYNEIAWSGLTTPSKQAIGFGINPFEDTKAAGQWYAQQKYKKMSKAKKQAQFQEIVRQGEAAEAAKKKAAADAAAAKQASLQARVTTQANREARRRISQGEGRDYGKTETRASSGWQSSPFNRGGLVDFYRYGGFI